MNWYGGGFIPIVIYSTWVALPVVPPPGEFIITENDNFIISETGDLLITE